MLTAASPATVFLESVDLVAHVLTYLPLNELAACASVSSSLHSAVRRRMGQIRRWRSQAKAFGESASDSRLSVPDLHALALVAPPNHNGEEDEEEVLLLLLPTLASTLRPLYNLTRLDLVACRVAPQDFAAALQTVRHTLQDLRMEMVHVMPATSLHPAPAPVHLPSLVRLEISPSNLALSRLIASSSSSLRRLASHKKHLQDKCSCCGQPRPSSKCGQCRFYAFCSRKCQVNNWSSDQSGHKQVCLTQDADSVAELLLGSIGSSLQELDLAHYWQPNLLFADDTVDHHQQQQSQWPVFTPQRMTSMFASLTALRLVRCGVRDEDVLHLTQAAPTMQRVDLSLNTKLTNVALQHMQRAWALTLVDVRVRQTYRLSDSGVRGLCCALRELEYADLRYGAKRGRGELGQVRVVSTTSTRTLAAIASACPRLRQARVLVSSKGVGDQQHSGKFLLDVDCAGADGECDFDETWGQVLEH